MLSMPPTSSTPQAASSPAHATYADALARVHDRIEQAQSDAGLLSPGARDSEPGLTPVRLLLATKTQDAAAVRAAVLADRAVGREPSVLVGENRVQELTAKAPELADLGLTAHLIGPLQSNKVNHALRALAQHGQACIETVDSLTLAEKIGSRVLAAAAEASTGDLPGADGQPSVGTTSEPSTASATLDVYVQVNVSGEESKAGVSPDAAVDLALAIAEVGGLRLCGFMTIGAQSTDEALVRGGFSRLREIRDEVLGSRAPGTRSATELSMGMSRDLEWAVAEGATLVRVGSAVFGAR